MNPQRFFLPTNMVLQTSRSWVPIVQNSAYMPNHLNFFSRVFGGLRSFNWQGFLSGANKTLNVMNQTIPLVRNVRPMVGNIKSMIKLAKAFGSETTKPLNVPKLEANINSSSSNMPLANNNPTFFV